MVELQRPARRGRHARLSWLAVLTCLGLAAGACGQAATPAAPASASAAPTVAASSAPTPAGPPASPGPTASPSVAVETPVASAAPSDKVLKVGWSSEPDTLNPLTTYSTEGTEVIQLLYDNLLGYGSDLKPEPELAQSFEYSADGTAITFKLRTGVTWSDGQPFTSDDVKYTYDVIRDNELSSYSQWLTHLNSVETPDAVTAVLHFDKPQAFDPALAIPILPKHIWSSMTPDQIQKFTNDAPVGTGPFTLVEWKKGESVTVVRNTTFWGPAPIPAGVAFVLYANEDVMAQGLKRGDVDVLTEVPPTIWDGLQGAANVKAVALSSWSFHHIGFNVSGNAASKGNPLLRDVKVRQALSYALDRNQLVQIALSGHGKPGSTIVPLGLTDWHYEPTASEAMNADPANANALLDAAGYTTRNADGTRLTADGKPLEFRLIAIESTAVDVKAAGLFVNAAAAVGIKLDLSTLDENTLGSTVYNKDAPDWDIFVWGWDSAVPDPGYMLGVPLCNQIGNNNDIFYCNKQYDTLYDQQASTVDPVARKAITDQMQQQFYQDAAYLVMWYQDKLQAYRTDTWTNWAEPTGGVVFNFTRDNYLHVTPAN
jgi:peptide/nickel transport system substrate-binding protein